MSISHLIGTYGYWAVFALVAAESVGIPMPGETALIIAAVYAGHTHHLSPWVIFVVALAGAIVGDNIGYGSATRAATASPANTGPRSASMSAS